MTLGARIRTAREAANITQAELARRVGVASHTPSRWERDAHRPYGRQLVALSRELGVSLDELKGGDDESAAAVRSVAEKLAADIAFALVRAVSENTLGSDRRRSRVPVSDDRRRGDRRALCA